MSVNEVEKIRLTLVAGERSDLALTGMVADVLEQQFFSLTQIIRMDQLTRHHRYHAFVTTAPAAHVHNLLDDIDLREIKTAGQGIVLIHPRPDGAHYALALRRGFADVIAWPHDLERWLASCQSLLNSTPPDSPIEEPCSMQLLGQSECMKKLRNRISRIAAFDSNVLLVGETGTGKECVAQAIHAHSARRDKPMVSLNCAALPEHLIESELFGYERGAFTGANNSHPGKFGLAEGGTLFLDEIGEMPRSAQAKILRVIESHEYYRLGGVKPLKTNVRLIAATHRDLEELSARDEFRQDLYFRLNVARFDLPALRDRVRDIVPIAEYFMRENCKSMKRKTLPISEEVRAVLCAYQWPGNVRELRNVIEIALINSESEQLILEDLPQHFGRLAVTIPPPPDERSLLLTALQNVQWNKSEAARVLNWSRMKLYRKLHQYGLALDDAASEICE